MDIWVPNGCDSKMEEFRMLVNDKYGLNLRNYHELWEWSCQEYDKFWNEFLCYSKIITYGSFTKVVDTNKLMSEIPTWFDGITLNYAENLLRYKDDNVAIISDGESVSPTVLTFKDVYDRTNELSYCFKNAGLGKGDIVASMIPNTHDSIISMLAVASIGAIWTCVSCDSESMGIIRRLRQIKPKFLLSYDEVTFNDCKHNQLHKLLEISKQIESLEKIIIWRSNSSNEHIQIPKSVSYSEFLDKNCVGFDRCRKLEFAKVPFNHPVFIMYSSGTTGDPKGLVHSVGGTLIQLVKEHILHGDMRRTDVLFFYTLTSWMMWNWTVTALFCGTTLVLYDGAVTRTKIDSVWKLVDKYKVTVLGCGSAYINYLHKSNYKPKKKFCLNTLRSLLSTGSCLPKSSYEYIYNSVSENILIGSISGGTDIISCFVGHNPCVPVISGRIQARNLGMAVYCFDDKGDTIYNLPGELVCVKPFPSMPIYMINDPNNLKYMSSYFSEFPNCWRQGDFCIVHNESHSITMLGRSDSTLNPNGFKYGSSEIYNILDEVNEITDSLCVSQDIDQHDERVILFIKCKEGVEFNESFIEKIKETICKHASKRHLPSLILQAPDIPYTLTGKKAEIVVRRIISGRKYSINTDSLRNPESLEYFKNLVF